MREYKKQPSLRVKRILQKGKKKKKQKIQSKFGKVGQGKQSDIRYLKFLASQNLKLIFCIIGTHLFIFKLSTYSHSNSMDSVFNYFLIGTQIHYALNSNSLFQNQQLNIYWNNSQNLLIQSPSLNAFYSQIISERLQYHLLHDHQRVLTQVQAQLSDKCQIYDSLLNNFVEQWPQIEGSQFVVLVLDEFLDKTIFTKQEADELRQKLNERKDFKRICTFLLAYIDKRLVWEFIYLFYVTLKLLKQKNNGQKYQLRINELMEIQCSSKGEQKYLIYFCQKFTHLKYLNNLTKNIKIIIITMMKAIKGEFINPFSNKLGNKSISTQVYRMYSIKKKEKKKKQKKYITRKKQTKINTSQY